MVPRAPKGHSIENVSQPKPDIVPILTPAMRPAAMPTNTTAPTTVRSRRVFSFAASAFAELFVFAPAVGDEAGVSIVSFFLAMVYPL